MADAEGRVIPWVEDDQGEGIKDFLDDFVAAGQKAESEIQKIIGEQLKKQREED